MDAVERCINTHILVVWQFLNEHTHLDGCTMVDLHTLLLLLFVFLEDLTEIRVLRLLVILYLARLYLVLFEILCVLLL